MRFSRHIGPALLLGVAALALAVALGYKLVRERQTAIEVARWETQSFARVLEEHARQTLLRVGSNLAQARSALGGLQHTTGGDLARLRQSLSATLPADRLIQYFLVLDAQGQRVLTTLSGPDVPVGAFAGADYFVAHVSGADRELVFGAVQWGGVPGQWLLPVSLAVRGPAGELRGVLVAMVQASHFQSFYDSIDHQGEGFTTLFSSSGVAVVTSPYADAVVGRNWSQSPLFQQHLPQWPTGTVQQRVVRDNVERIYSYRALNDYPVVVSYGLALDGILADWRTAAWRDGLLGLAGMVLLGLAAARLARTERRRLMAEKTLAESEASYRSLIDFSPVGIAVQKAGRIVYANPAAVSILGAQSAQQLLGRRLLRFVHRDVRRLTHTRMREALALGRKLEVRIVCIDGSAIDVEVQATMIPFEREQAVRVSIQDITQRKRVEANLRIAATAFESQEGVVVTDTKNVILRVNNAFTQMTGYSAEEAVGRTPRLLHSGRQDASFYEAMWKVIQETGSWQGELWNRRKNGEEYPEHLSITAVRDGQGTLTHYVATMIDITLRRAAADEIERLAFFDPLTRLPNRRLLMDRLRQALAGCTRHNRHGALLFLDLDHFKTLNDTLGHDLGDALLRQVAQRLGRVVREGDTVARLGGDEFVVLLEDLDEGAREAAEQTQAIGEKILAALNLPYQLDDTHQNHSTASVGAVLFSEQQQSFDDLLRQTDLAMYAAKAAGRNTIRFFDPQMQADISERAALEVDLRTALAERQFELYYQKQVRHDGSAVGAEVLIRWIHPQRGMILPGGFIAQAEETGQIIAIGDWVLRSACMQLKRWESDPGCEGLCLAVNVSARQFRQADFVQQVRDVLQATGARADRLKLELTESTVLHNVQDTIATMHALKTLGVRFSIDDFGTGQSSLSYLTQLPLDQLKIDQSFVRNIGIRPVDALIAQTIIGMANNLGLEVIAEGVETQAQRTFLERHGCLLCQGYLFGRPVPLAQFEASLG